MPKIYIYTIMRKFKVTCLKCKKSDILTIDDGHRVWEYGGKLNTNFLSARFRGDSTWGFECICGNDNRLAASEEGDFGSLVINAAPVAAKNILDSLKIPDAKQFRMENA